MIEAHLTDGPRRGEIHALDAKQPPSDLKYQERQIFYDSRGDQIEVIWEVTYTLSSQAGETGYYNFFKKKQVRKNVLRPAAISSV